MGHHIHAIVGRPAIVERARELSCGRPFILLDAGFAWVPVFADALDLLAERGVLPNHPWEDGFVHLGGPLPAFLAELSTHGPVAYIGTEYFGGTGAQAAAVFDRGRRVLVRGGVNAALRAIGVHVRAGLDEWDAVGLGKLRDMPD